MSLSDLLVPALVSRPTRLVLLIDGGSGSGKTSLAQELQAMFAEADREMRMVSLDDLYPGWEGLAQASTALVDDVLRADDPGYRRWDWVRSEPASWVEIDPDEDLIIEGCGSLTGDSAPMATASVWLEVEAAERKRRGIARDGAAYAPHWDRWAAQEQAHWAAHRPWDLADLCVVDHRSPRC